MIPPTPAPARVRGSWFEDGVGEVVVLGGWSSAVAHVEGQRKRLGWTDPSPHAACARPAGVTPPTLTLAQAYGPTSATATAAGAAGIVWARWEFTATPARGAASTQVSDTPLVWWYNLAANMKCEHGSLAVALCFQSAAGNKATAPCQPPPAPHHHCLHNAPCADTISVVGTTRSGKRAAGASTLTLTTPREGAPTVADAIPITSTQAIVRLSPPTNGQPVSLYITAVCLQSQPTNCKRLSRPSIQFSFSALTPGASYVVSATAKVGNTTVPASNTLPLVMPQRGAPVLLSAAATSAVTGSATAAPPPGTTFGKVGARPRRRGGQEDCVTQRAGLACCSPQQDASHRTVLGGWARVAEQAAALAICAAFSPPPSATSPLAVRVHRPVAQRPQRHLYSDQPTPGPLRRPAPRHPVSSSALG